MSKRSQETPLIRPLAAVLLLAFALAESLLSVYQWMELVVVRSGGTAVCALSDALDCTKVWSSAFATRTHALLGMPVAGLGLLWGLTAFGLSALLAHRALARREVGVPSAAIRLAAAVGVLSCVTFAVASFRTGAFCITCIGTYLLVLGFAAVALRMLPGELLPPNREIKPALAWAVALALPLYLALLYPGQKTPGAHLGLSGVAAAASGEEALAKFIGGLSWAEKQALSDSLAVYQRSPAPDVGRFKTRHRFGAESAPVRIVDFTDIRCGHCRSLVEVLSKLKQVAPPGSISVESRHFPLDSECNKLVTHSDGSQVRCLAAKAQICLEGAPDFWELQHKLFEAQEDLSKERVLEIASSGSVGRAKLEACIGSPETEQKLNEDIAYAALFAPQGTPLVVVNGREGTPAAAWLYAMAMTGGNIQSKAFAGLPPPRP
ncbi:MAG: thioredoxin domain-containing protein [Myxococcales bacterium]|nr:thioredoxin domain-containing protein [Myxococcales bacterium]